MDSQLGAQSPKIDKIDVLRGIIPTYDNVGTKYVPCRDYLMIVPLPDQTQVGDILLPDRSITSYTEGHVVARGPHTTGTIVEGDCVTWSPHTEISIRVDKGGRFVLLQEHLVIMKIPRDSLHSCPEGEDCSEKTAPTSALTLEQALKEAQDLGHSMPDPLEE